MFILYISYNLDKHLSLSVFSNNLLTMSITKFTLLTIYLLHLPTTFAQPAKYACNPPHDRYPFCNTSLTIDVRVHDLIARIPNSIKPNLLTARGNLRNKNRQAIPSLGVPSYYWGSNCIHSSMFSNCTIDGQCSVSFPAGPNMAAMFDQDILQKIANVVGTETRAGWNLNWLDNGENGAGLDCWGPVLNVNRDPRWGRNGEGGSEDPYLMGSLGKAWSSGLQNSNDPNSKHMLVSITIKHFVANSVEGSWSTNGQIWGDKKESTVTRHTIDANISKYALQDYYWPAFRKSIVEGGAAGVMCSYNMVNGKPTCLDPLQNAIRKQWGFSGYVTSDSDSIDDAWRAHGFVKSGQEASCEAVSKGGCDIDSGNTYYNYLLQGVNQSLCTMADVDQRLFNTFKIRFRLGLFDPQHEQSPFAQLGAKDIGTETSIALNLIAAEESLVLLQKSTKPILPLDSNSKTTIAVVGPHGNATRSMIQVDTGKICPNGEYDCIESPFHALSVLNTNGKTTYNKGVDLIGTDESLIQEAVEAAQNADVVVLAVGITSCGDWWTSPDIPKDLKHCHFNNTDGSRYLEAEAHDRDTIEFPPIQLKLINEILILKKPTIVILMHGGQIAIEALLNLEHVSIIDAFYPGAMGGQAIGNAIFGVSNRWGKLPYSMYNSKWTEDHNMLEHEVSKDKRTYRYMDAVENEKYLNLPFGFGLALTEYTMTNTQNDTTIILNTDGTSKDVNVVIKICMNEKEKEKDVILKGDEIVQVYVLPKDVPTLTTFPLKSLINFQRIKNIEQGTTRTVEFKINIKDLLMTTKEGDRVSEPGKYDVVFETGTGVEKKVTIHIVIEGDRVVYDAFPVVE